MKTKNKFKVNAEMSQLLRNTVSADPQVASAAKMELAIALAMPLKKAVLFGDTHSFIFAEEEFQPGIAVEFPLDFVGPNNEGLYTAYTVPNTGKIPERHIEGDYLQVPTFDIATSIDWSRKYARDARWPVVARAYQVAESAIVRKKNNDAWHVILAAAVARGLAVYDDAAVPGFFSKRLISLGKTVMRRSTGGNSTSVGQGRLTHVALSPEGLEDIRSWDLTQVDDVTRREIFMAGDGESSLTQIFKTTLIDLDELGVGQEYQRYYTNVLAATLPSTKTELVIGLDLAAGDSFYMPYRVQPNGQRIEMQGDPTFIRQNREGYWWREEYGVAQLDSRRSLVLAF